MARMKEIRAEMAARENVPNQFDGVAVNVRVQAEIAVEAMERMVFVFNEMGE